MSGINNPPEAGGGVVQTAILLAQRTAAAGTGTQSLTGAGFTPTWCNINAIVDSDTFVSIGFSDTLEAGEAVEYRTTLWHRRAAELLRLGSGTDAMSAINGGFTADGIDIDWTKIGAGKTVSVQVLCGR